MTLSYTAVLYAAILYSSLLLVSLPDEDRRLSGVEHNKGVLLRTFLRLLMRNEQSFSYESGSVRM